MREAWRLGCNPGGEVLSAPLTELVPKEAWRNRLLSREEAAQADEDHEPVGDAVA